MSSFLRVEGGCCCAAWRFHFIPVGVSVNSSQTELRSFLSHLEGSVAPLCTPADTATKLPPLNNRENKNNEQEMRDKWSRQSHFSLELLVPPADVPVTITADQCKSGGEKKAPLPRSTMASSSSFPSAWTEKPKIQGGFFGSSSEFNASQVI